MNMAAANVKSDCIGGLQTSLGPPSPIQSAVSRLAEQNNPAVSAFPQSFGNVKIVNSPSVCTYGNRYYKEDVHNGEVVSDLPLPKYVGRVIKKSTKAERISCGVVTLVVLFSVSVTLYYFLAVVRNTGSEDIDQSEWFIRSDLWLARPFEHNLPMLYEPIKMVVIQHSGGPSQCFTFSACATLMNVLQDSAMQNHMDIVYNFVIGNDGRVYEGRGWGIVSENNLRFNPCSISIGFMGNYMNIHATELQLERTKMLLEQGVIEGHVHPNYTIVGSRDIRATLSPGENLYRDIQQFEHYNTSLTDLICDQIHASDNDEFHDIGEWFISRERWEAQPFHNHESTKKYDPLKLVIINHSVTTVCFSLAVCILQMQHLQATFLLNNEQDIPYNFLIGNDGRVYEGRGWGVWGGEGNQDYEPCALNIAFIGHYSPTAASPTNLSPRQVSRAQQLIAEGVKHKYLDENYSLVGARDLRKTESPGDTLYEDLQTWPQYDHEARYAGMSCEKIHSLE